MGKSVVRAVGYIERPRESLSVILEPSEDSVMQLVKDNKLNAEFTVRNPPPLFIQYQCRNVRSPSLRIYTYCIGAQNTQKLFANLLQQFAVLR